jgi:hypothetical protein
MEPSGSSADRDSGWQERGKHLAERSNTTKQEIDWVGLLEEFCQHVHAAERRGQPAVSLRDLPRPDPGDMLDLHGLRLLLRHPVVLFGDGGSPKSYLSLYLAGELAQRGYAVGLFDWELAGEDHRDRLERLFGADMPDVKYVRCDRPITAEADRLRRIVREEQLQYAVFDSVSFACGGPPEAGEAATSYYRAVRQIGIGSLNIAHISKAEGGDQKPFGSAFWHNGARATWYAEVADNAPTNHQITVGLYNRNANLGPLRPPVGFSLTFDADRTVFERVNVADVEKLAAKLSMSERMAHLLRRSPMTIAAIADELEAKADTVEKTSKRSQRFARVPGPDGIYRIALAERRYA